VREPVNLRTPTSIVIVVIRCRSILRRLRSSARVLACLIHQVAYAENLRPRRQSNFSTARTRPRLPPGLGRLDAQAAVRDLLDLIDEELQLVRLTVGVCEPKDLRLAGGLAARPLREFRQRPWPACRRGRPRGPRSLGCPPSGLELAAFALAGGAYLGGDGELVHVAEDRPVVVRRVPAHQRLAV
jgi:hypothetical protein